MRIEEAKNNLRQMTIKNHDVDLFLKCVKTLENNPETLIEYSSLIALYVAKIDYSATIKILSHSFQHDKDKIRQLEVLSSLSYSGSVSKQYLPLILNDDRSIAFEICSSDYDSYSMLLNSLPKEYSFNRQKLKNKNELISIWKNTSH